MGTPSEQDKLREHQLARELEKHGVVFQQLPEGFEGGRPYISLRNFTRLPNAPDISYDHSIRLIARDEIPQAVNLERVILLFPEAVQALSDRAENPHKRGRHSSRRKALESTAEHNL